MPKAVAVRAAAQPTANRAPKDPVHQTMSVFPRYAHPMNSQLLAAHHATNALAEWRKMYGLLIHHYEANGHSCVNSTQQPQLCQWLKHQQFKYAANALSAQQVQQLRLMKVEFIDRNQVKLGKKCERKECTKFAAFEGFCHEHFSVGFRSTKSPSKREIIHPAYKHSKLTAHNLKTQQLSTLRPNLTLMPSMVPARELNEDATHEKTNSLFHRAKRHRKHNDTPAKTSETVNSRNTKIKTTSDSPKNQQQHSSDPSTASRNNDPAKSLQGQHNQAIWLKHYGSLILFYERYGHSNVTLQNRKDIVTPSLITWVHVQRERYKKGLLSADEVKRLNLLDFAENIDNAKIAGSTGPHTKRRCIVKQCEKFAVFNGKCHTHYTNESDDVITTSSTEVCENSQATSLSGEKRKIQATINKDAGSDSNPRPLKQVTQHHSAINTALKHPVFIPPREPNSTTDNDRKFPINVPTELAVRRPKEKKKPVSKPQFPLVGFSKQKNGLYTLVDSQERASNTKSKDLSRDQMISKLSNYISNLSSSANCITVWNHIHTQCTCLHYLRNKSFAIEAVSNAILDYYEMTPKEKKRYAVERIRMAENAAEGRKINYQKEGPLKMFMLPLSYDYLESAIIPQATDTSGLNNNMSKEAQISQLFRHKICSSSWHNLHNIGREKKDTLQRYIKGDTSVNRHKACGNKNRGKSCQEARNSVRTLLLSLFEEYRNENAGGGPEEEVVLPPSFSKRLIWHRWIRDQGWLVKILDRKKGTMAKSKDWELLPGFYASEADAIQNGGKVVGQKMSLTNFTFFWRDEFPKLKVVEGMMKGSHFLSQKESVRALLQSLFDEYSEYDNDPKEVVVLPLSFSKRQLWHDWIKEQGWRVNMEKGKIAKAKDWELLPGFYATEADAAENGGKVAGQKMSYASFYVFWRDEFPRLKVIEGTRSKGKSESFMDDYEDDG